MARDIEVSKRETENAGAAPADLADRFIAASKATPTNRVTIAGHENFQLMIALCRRGFTKVECQAANFRSRAASTPADILFASHIRSEADLSRVLAGIGCRLCRDGVLVVDVTADDALFSERQLRTVLLDSGFATIERLGGCDERGTLWCAHRRAPALALAA